MAISGGVSVGLPGFSASVGGGDGGAGGSLSVGAPGLGFTGAVSLNTRNLSVGLNGGGLQLGLNAGGVSIGASLPGARIGLGISLGAPSGPVPGQTFRNQPLPNFRSSLYQLVIRAPKPPFGVVFGYTFPISPASLRKEPVALTAIYDVASADPNMLGVQRMADMWGQTPPMYSIEGTTGFQYHGSDGMTLTGIDSIIALQNVLTQYASLNQQQIQSQLSEMYLLEFYDYYTNEHWQVVPIGPQSVMQDRSRPLYINYSFRFAGIRSLAAPPPPAGTDSIAQDFSATPAQAQASVHVAISNLNLHYGGVTLRTG